MKRRWTWTFVVVVVVGGAVAVWPAVYPGPCDPKNIEYVLWKHGLRQLEMERVICSMIGDRHRDDLVVGKTVALLRDRFGSLLTAAEASPYLRGCYQDSPWKDRDVLFLGRSPWMVVFDAGRAQDLVLIKGC